MEVPETPEGRKIRSLQKLRMTSGRSNSLEVPYFLEILETLEAPCNLKTPEILEFSDIRRIQYILYIHRFQVPDTADC
jgi:hypothetical protein